MTQSGTNASTAMCPISASEMDARIARIARESRDKRLGACYRQYRSGALSLARLNTCLMDTFREYRNLEAYSLLYELNWREFLTVIVKRLRYSNSALDANDVLQDVFVSIFRYPHKFRDEKEFSFRNWSYSIIRNTILKHLRSSSNQPTLSTEQVAETVEDESQESPLGALVHEENRDECGHMWLLFLANYLHAFHARLNDRERRALTLVEVEGVRYREASEVLGIKLENLKMVICRARKKIFRTVAEIVGGDE